MYQKVNRIITVVSLVVIIAVVAFFFNGTTVHDIQGNALEQTFLQTLSQNGMTAGIITKEENHFNSKTLFFENETGQKAVATYVKSIYGDRWKQVFFIPLNEGENIKKEGLLFPIDDHIFQYELKYEQMQNGQLTVSLTGEQKPIFTIRLFGLGVIVTAAVIGRIVGVWLGRNKLSRLMKENEKNKKDKK